MGHQYFSVKTGSRGISRKALCCLLKRFTHSHAAYLIGDARRTKAFCLVGQPQGFYQVIDIALEDAGHTG